MKQTNKASVATAWNILDRTDRIISDSKSGSNSILSWSRLARVVGIAVPSYLARELRRWFVVIGAVLLKPPRGTLSPIAQFVGRPRRGFVGVTGGAWIGDLIFIRHLRRDKPEGVSMYESARNTLCFDLRHMAGYALASRTAVFVMRMLF